MASDDLEVVRELLAAADQAVARIGSWLRDRLP
jgi:hypothetical protein